MRFYVPTLLLLFIVSIFACSDDDPATGGSNASSSASSLSASSTATSSSSAAASPLYISEYVEGSNNNKYVEIFNSTDTAVNLSRWTLKRYLNGAVNPSESLSLSGTVAAHSVFVVCRDPLGTWEGTENLKTTSDVLNYSGNDPVGLYNGETLIDIVGQPGNAADHIKDMTLVRKPGTSASATFNTDDWYQLAIDTLSNLGTHDPVNAMSSSSASSALSLVYDTGSAGNELFISEFFSGIGNDKYIELYNASLATINLADYRLVRIDVNPSGVTNLADSYCRQLSGELYKNSALLIVNKGFSTNRLTVLNAYPTESGTTFGNTRKIVESPIYPNGICFFGNNDPVYLVKNGKTVDALGVAQAADWGKEVVIIKKSTMRGNPVWNSGEWDMTPLLLATASTYSDDYPDMNAGTHYAE